MTKDKNQIRRENLKLLAAVVGSKKELAKIAGVSQNYMYQVEARGNLGDRVCNSIEAGLSLPIGWMDSPQTTATYLDSIHSIKSPSAPSIVIDKKMLTECIADALHASDDETSNEVVAMVAASLYITKQGSVLKELEDKSSNLLIGGC